MAPWLSVLIPVYNVRDYLAECVASVLAQAPDDGSVEVLLLDDCSTDGSLRRPLTNYGRAGRAACVSCSTTAIEV